MSMAVCEHTFVLSHCWLDGEMLELAVCTSCRGVCLPESRLMTGWLRGRPTWRVVDADGNLEHVP
jgi:hypothetical protein